MASREGSSEPHFLLLPFVDQGHIIPMLSLASQLLALGCRVTFVKAERSQLTTEEKGGRQISGEEAPERLHFVSVEELSGDDKLAADHVSSSEKESLNVGAFKILLESLEERRGPLVARLLRESAHPISGVICDFFLWKWVSPLSRSHGVPLAVHCGCGATFFHMLYLLHKGKYSEVEDLLVSGFGLPSTEFSDGLTSSKDALAVKENTSKFFLDMLEGFDDAGHQVLANSFLHLEAPLLPYIEASPLEYIFIGPSFPVWRRSRAMAQRAGCPFLEEQSCMPWLDKQERGSVLFVSFGSVAVLRDEAQMEEIAVGIEKSGHKFLWIARPDAPEGMLPPKAFRERVLRGDEELGMFVQWAPQKRVLQHPAVGGFLTHSGWNSTIESVTYGVPMLCLPFLADQPFTASMVQWYWKVGMRLECSAGMVGREEVEKGVRSIMQLRHTSQRVAEYQKAAQAAIADGCQRVASFVKSMTGAAPTQHNAV